MKHRLAFVTILAVALIAASTAYAQRIKPNHSGFFGSTTPSAPSAHTTPSSPKSAAPASPLPSSASTMHSRIAAVVNDNVISTTDLNDRVAMAFLSSGLPNTPEVRARLTAQILRLMIDEQLQLQEAKKAGVSVSQTEIDQALDHISQENNIPGGDIKTFLSSHGIPPEALINQIKASLSWNKVIQRELRPRVDVGDDEVDAVLERTRANAGKQEFQVGEIFLSVDNPKDEDQVKNFADNLVHQLRQGANFGAVARQFSQNANAASGGDIGWIQENQLAPELNRALLSLQPGQISDPIRSSSGYHILGLREKRTITVSSTGTKNVMVELQQAFRPFGNDKEAVLKETQKLRASMTDCNNLQNKLSVQFPAWRWQDLGDVKLSTAPGWIADKTRDLPVGKSTEPMEVNKGALVLFVCGRKNTEGSPEREAITNQIGTEKLEMQARGLLRDLRRNAYLDVRLANVQ